MTGLSRSVCAFLCCSTHGQWDSLCFPSKQELTFVIKQDIANINKQIASLQAYVKQRKLQSTSKSPESKQLDEHNNNVVMLLQNKLAETSMTFKDVLEIRTQVRYCSKCLNALRRFTVISLRT